MIIKNYNLGFQGLLKHSEKGKICLLKACVQILIDWSVEYLSYNLGEQQTNLQMFTFEDHTSLLQKLANYYMNVDKCRPH